MINETLDGFVARPSNLDMNKYLLTYQNRRGGFPRDEIDATPDQIGALRQVIATGASPYVDFMFGVRS